MPKMKSKSAAKKRFKVTGSGRIRAHQAGIRHNFENMSGDKKRAKAPLVDVEGGHEKVARRLLGMR